LKDIENEYGVRWTTGFVANSKTIFFLLSRLLKLVKAIRDKSECGRKRA